MGTLNTAIVKIRLRINENKVQFYTDADLVSLINDQINYSYHLMKGIECRAIINPTEFTLVDGTEEYVIADYGGVITGQVFNVNMDAIPLYSEFKPELFSYQPSALGIKFFNFADADEVVVYSWATLPELLTTTVAIATADLPYDGYWDLAITRAVVVECQEVREHDNSRTSVFASTDSDNALYAVSERYGMIARRMQGTLNV